MNMQLLKMALSLLEHTWMNTHKDPVHMCAFYLTLWTLNHKEKIFQKKKIYENNFFYLKLYFDIHDILKSRGYSKGH